jgi:phosphate transport system protein
MAMEIRKNFHHELDLVSADIVRMASMMAESLPRATEAFLGGDLTTAEEIIQSDDEVDELALAIEERCYQLLALQQPMASDLRALTTAIRLTAEVERSADLVCNIMKGSRRIFGTEIDPRIRGLIQRLSDQVHGLYRFAIDAYADRDAGLAAALDDMDDAIDALHVEYIASIFETRESGELPLQVAVQLALIGRFYERIADHAVNIGERVSYMVNGWLPEHTGAARAVARRSSDGH